MLLCLSGVASAQQVTIVGSLPFGAMYVADGWLPIRIDVKNEGDREVVGTARVTPIDETTPEFRTPIRAPAKSRVVKTLWGYFPYSKSNLIGRVTLHDASGAQLSRVEMTGASSAAETVYLPNGIYEHGFMVSIAGEEWDTSDYVALDPLAETLTASYEIHSNLVQIDVASAPASATLYRSAFAVQLRSADPDVLPPEARQAILDYVRSGGVLLITAPDVKQVGGSWLEPLLPVRLLGNREMDQVVGQTGKDPMKFAMYLNCAEALAGDGEVLIRDGQYVHAAYRKLGLGRIVFTSFPAGALPLTDVRSGQFWYEAMGFGRHPIGIAGTMAQDRYPQLMEPMLGRKAASWGIAAAAVGALVVLVILAHMAWRGAARPTAFKISLAASILIAAGFSLLAALRQESEPLQEAKLTVIEASPEGSFANEYAAVSGSQQMVDRVANDSRATVKAALVRQDRPVLTQWPMAVERVEVNPQRVDLVSLTSVLDRTRTAAATGRFGPEGLQLSVQNNLGVDLASTQLGWGPYRLSIPTIAAGQYDATVNSSSVRPLDEYTSAAGLASQDEQHKGEILRALLQTRNVTKVRREWPTVYGWAGAWHGLTKLDGEQQPDRVGMQTLVRIPLELQPSQGPVRIDGVFNEMYLEHARGLPYDAARREFIQTTMPGDWIIGVQYPLQVGLLRPSKARLTIGLETSQHRVQIRKGQCPGGKAPTGRGNPNGELIADWTTAVGVQSVDFECTPDDFDAEGRVWLRISVQTSSTAGAMGVEPQWRFGQLLVDLEGDVTQSSTQP